jgi:hypothetical protein
MNSEGTKKKEMKRCSPRNGAGRVTSEVRESPPPQRFAVQLCGLATSLCKGLFSTSGLALTLLVGLALAGCGRQEAGGPTGNPKAAAGETEAASAPAGQATAAPASQGGRPPRTEPAGQPLYGLVHPFMTTQLRRYVAENGRLPKDFNEFARAKMDSVPRLPSGVKFAIDPVTQEVKMVAQ